MEGNGIVQKKLTLFYLFPLTTVFFINCMFSLLETTYFETNMHIELPRYKSDHPGLLLIALLITFAIFLIMMKKVKVNAETVQVMRCVSCFWAAGISVFFVLIFRCGVVCDSGIINEAVIQIMQGNYEAFEEGAYLHHYPFQLGFVAVLELVYRLFGIENFFAFQFINVIAIVVIIYLLQKITEKLFNEGSVVICEAILSIGMLPLYLFATFIYGDLIGFALGIGAIYCGILYIKENCWKYLLIAGILFTIAIIVKSNIYVLMVAFSIALLLKMVQEKRWNILLWLIGIWMLSQSGMQIVNFVYANRSGMDEMWEGTPKAAWIAMSMQEADEESNGCGWYNGYNWKIYTENDYDNVATTQVCIDNIKDSINNFISNPKYALYYAYRKFTSQWNAPTFQSVITNEWYSRYTENKFAIADFLTLGAGRKILYQLMNFYHFLMFVCSSAGLLYLIKNWSLERAYLALNIFGGLLFHMIWEAQSRYILGYYVMMLPLAAVGCKSLLGRFDYLVNKLKRNKLKGR